MTSVPDLITEAMRRRLSLARLAAGTVLSLTWATLHLWDYPGPGQRQPRKRDAPPGAR
jgi:hypothetical protein